MRGHTGVVTTIMHDTADLDRVRTAIDQLQPDRVARELGDRDVVGRVADIHDLSATGVRPLEQARDRVGGRGDALADAERGAGQGGGDGLAALVGLRVHPGALEREPPVPIVQLSGRPVALEAPLKQIAVNAGLEGTEFVVRVLPDQTIVSVLEGRVAVSNALGRLSLSPGQTASASRDSPPVLRLEIRPEDTVHWALYYPLIIDTDQPGADRNVLAAQRELTVGRADRAGEQLDALLARVPTNARALALAAITALAQNAVDRAMDLAERAVAAAPRDSSAQLALSYVRQARFDLVGARAAVDSALASNPNDALAWARLAELQAAFGETNEAIRTAQRAVQLEPGLSRTQSVLGFAALSRLDLAQAAEAFDNAITRDPADPLPRIGQALIKIRRGDLAEGRRDLEIAVSLDPGNALARSYLGNAYFQERRDVVAAVELANAKVLEVSQAPLNQGLGETTLGEALLAPTRIYVKALLALLADTEVHALAHITGGGLAENLDRVVPAAYGIELRRNSWEVPPIFRLIQQAGPVEDAEMRQAFNLGIVFLWDESL